MSPGKMMELPELRQSHTDIAL